MTKTRRISPNLQKCVQL